MSCVHVKKPELRKIQYELELNKIEYKLFREKYMDYDLIINKNNSFKENTNAYFLCHCGLGDFFNNSGAIRFLSYFYDTIYLFCPAVHVKKMKIHKIYSLKNCKIQSNKAMILICRL